LRSLALALLLLLPPATFAAELTPFAFEDHLCARILDAAFPEKLSKELTSGLTNRILVRVVLSADDETMGQKSVELAIRYDLWDENFPLVMTVDGTVVDSRTYASLAELRAYLANLTVRGLFRRAEVPAARPLTLRADLLLNPIDRERLEKIRKWVAENSTYTPSGSGGFGGAGASTSSIIFNKIFEQYAAGSDLATTWQATVTSRPFTVESVSNERP